MRQCILLAELLVGRSPIVTEEEMHGSPPQWGVIDNKALTLPPCTKFLLKTLLGVGVPGSRRCHSSFLPSAHTAVDVIRAHNNSPLHTHHTDRSSSSSYTSGLCVRSIVCNGLSRSLFTCCFSCQCLPLPPPSPDTRPVLRNVSPPVLYPALRPSPTPTPFIPGHPGLLSPPTCLLLFSPLFSLSRHVPHASPSHVKSRDPPIGCLRVASPARLESRHVRGRGVEESVSGT